MLKTKTISYYYQVISIKGGYYADVARHEFINKKLVRSHTATGALRETKHQAMDDIQGLFIRVKGGNDD